MQKIDIRRLTKISGISITEMGVKLFPENKQPYKAINRVMAGKAILDAKQIAKLAEVLNVPIGLLFTDDAWLMTAPKDRRIFQFRNYDFLAEFNRDTNETTISCGDSVYFEKIQHEEGITLDKYLTQIAELIIKYKQNEHN